MEPVSAEEYRRGRTKMVKLKSNKVFEIQKPSPLTLIKMMKTFGLEIPVGAKPDELEKSINEAIASKKLTMDELAEMLSVLIPDCSKRPKIVLGEANSPQDLSIDELDREDAFELFELMMEHSGMGGEAAEIRKSFQQ